LLQFAFFLSSTRSFEKKKHFSLFVVEESEKKNSFALLLFCSSLSLSTSRMASAPATGSAATKEAIKRVLVVIGERLLGRLELREKKETEELDRSIDDG